MRLTNHVKTGKAAQRCATIPDYISRLKVSLS